MSSRDQAAAAFLARVSMACDGALLGVTLAVGAFATWAKYCYGSNALGLVRAAPSPRISDLRSLLSPDSSDGKGDDASSSPSPEGKLVVIRGVVRERWVMGPSNQTALVSHGSGERAVIVQRIQTCLYNDWRGLFDWGFDLHSLFINNRKEQQAISSRSVPFILVEGSGSWPPFSFVHVKLDGASHPLPLTTVFHQLLPVQASSSSFIQALFGIGFPVAILDEEKILPVGKEITAVGFCRLQDGALEIKPSDDVPCFLSDKTKDEIVADLAIKTTVLFWSGAVLGTLSVGILGYAIVRNWWRWKEWRRMRQQRRRQRSVDAEEIVQAEDEESGDVPDGQLCVICLTRRRRSAFTPCGHLVCCPRCAMMVEREDSPKCPLCRQSIRSSVRIYDS